MTILCPHSEYLTINSKHYQYGNRKISKSQLACFENVRIKYDWHFFEIQVSNKILWR